jgi:hypothetical protein
MTSDLRTGLFLTPDNPVGSTVAPKIFMPIANPVEFQALIMGAFSLLFNADNYQQFGVMTEEETAQYYRNLQVIEMDLCDYIVNNCLTQGGFVDAIIGSLLSSGIGNGATGGSNSPVAGISEEVLGTSDCSENSHYGLCFEIISNMNSQAEQLLDGMSGLTTVGEVGAELAENIPIIGQYLSSAIEVANYVLNSAVSGYAVAWSLTSHEDIAGYLYCETLSSCQVTVNDLLNTYIHFMVGTVPDSTADFFVVAEYLNQIDQLLATAVVSALQYLVVQSWLHGSAFWGTDQRALEIAMYSHGSIPPPIDIDCNFPVTVEWDFTVNDGGWALQTDKGVYVPSVGWVATSDSSDSGVWIYKAIPPDCEVVAVEIGEVDVSLASWRRAAVLRNNVASSSGQLFIYDATSTISGTHVDCGSISPLHRNFILVFINRTKTHSATIQKIRMRFEGTPPSGYTDTDVSLTC